MGEQGRTGAAAAGAGTADTTLVIDETAESVGRGAATGRARLAGATNTAAAAAADGCDGRVLACDAGRFRRSSRPQERTRAVTATAVAGEQVLSKEGSSRADSRGRLPGRRESC
jgi:hypothetical protein